MLQLDKRFNATIGFQTPKTPNVLVLQEGLVALNRSPEFCLKLTCRYLLKAGHVPDDTRGGINFGARGII